MRRETLAAGDEPMAAGWSELLKKHQARDLSGLLEAARYKEQNQSSPDFGFQRINEYHPNDDRWWSRDVPAGAVSTCNDGKSYCDANGDVVQHTVAQERVLMEQFGRQYDTRNFRVDVPSAAEPEQLRGTLSVGASLGACAEGVCAGLTVEGTLGRNGSADAAVSAYISASAETASVLAPDASVHVKITNAADAGDVASGTEQSEGGQLGVVGADHVAGEGYDGAQVTLGPPSIGVRTGLSHTLHVAKHH